MIKKLSTPFFCILLLAGTMLMSGCYAHQHVVGQGGQSGQTDEARQWYILWGLVPINEVDTQEMAGGQQNYTIETETSVMDIVINIFTGIITVYSRTVTVTK